MPSVPVSVPRRPSRIAISILIVWPLMANTRSSCCTICGTEFSPSPARLPDHRAGVVVVSARDLAVDHDLAAAGVSGDEGGGPVVAFGPRHAPNLAAGHRVEHHEKATVEVIEQHEQAAVVQYRRRAFAERAVHAQLHAEVLLPDRLAVDRVDEQSARSEERVHALAVGDRRVRGETAVRAVVALVWRGDGCRALPEGAPGLAIEQAKFAGEGYLGLWNRMHDLSTISMRFGNVYGPRQDPLGEAGVIAIFCGKLETGGQPTVFGDGLQTRDYVFVEDVVQACMAAGDSDVTGSYNVGRGKEVTVLDIVDSLREIWERARDAQRRPHVRGAARARAAG